MKNIFLLNLLEEDKQEFLIAEYWALQNTTYIKKNEISKTYL